VYALDQEDNAHKFSYNKDASAFSNCGYLSSDKLSGDSFKQNTTLSYDKQDGSDYYWVSGTNYPVLKAFAPGTPAQQTSLMSLFSRAVAVVASLFN
jgi:hypothetical protein